MNAKKLIRDAFYILCQSSEPEEISVNAIIKKAGVNRSTFYYYFENKDHLTQQLQLEILDTFFNILYFEGKYKEIILEHYGSFSSPELYANCRYVQLNKHIFKIWLNDIEFVNKFVSRLIQYLEGFSSNETQCIFLAYGSVGYFRNWIANNCSVPSNEIAKDILQMSKQSFANML